MRKLWIFPHPLHFKHGADVWPRGSGGLHKQQHEQVHNPTGFPERQVGCEQRKRSNLLFEPLWTGFGGCFGTKKKKQGRTMMEVPEPGGVQGWLNVQMIL